VTQSDSVTIYHHPACGPSCNTLGLIRTAGIEPSIIEYLRNASGSGVKLCKPAENVLELLPRA
jgi:hypothetical protein